MDFGKKQENYHTQAESNYHTGGEGGLLQIPWRQHHMGTLSSVHTLKKKACQHPYHLRCLGGLRLPLKGQQTLLSAAGREMLAAWRPKVWGVHKSFRSWNSDFAQTYSRIYNSSVALTSSYIIMAWLFFLRTNSVWLRSTDHYNNIKPVRNVGIHIQDIYLT